ncbi:MAG: GNAT family N-acetyltransferase [Caldilineaceae bacterium]|nr:GNAT family N-acetyltransferase [Caldilineaceae bacterium]
MNSDCLCTDQPVATARAVPNRYQGQLITSVYGPDAVPTGFDALAAEWNSVVQRSRFNSIFLTHEWQTTWWNALGKGDLWIVAFRRDDTHELVGIAPLFLNTVSEGPDSGKRQLNLVGCIEVSDYLDLLAVRGWEQAVYSALLAWLRGPDAPAWDILDICNVPEDSLTYRELPPLYQAAGLAVSVTQEDTAPQFVLPLRYEEYLQEQVDKKQRHEIRRKQRRAEREAVVDFYRVGPQHVLEAEVDDFVALQRASRPDKADFMTAEMRRFFLAVARRMLEAGYLRLLFLTLDGEKAATLFAFEYNHRFWLYNSGYDPDSHSQLSPGWVLLAYAIQYAIASGSRVFDFMQGDEEYKYRFGAQDYKVMRVIVRRCAQPLTP